MSEAPCTDWIVPVAVKGGLDMAAGESMQCKYFNAGAGWIHSSS
jgi:hypothetical protein